MTIDPALWTVRPAFGVAGGPDEIVLTDEGLARAFTVGAQVRRGAAAEALAALAAAGGTGLTSTLVGARHVLTALGRFDQVAWGHLRTLGYIESFERDGVRLTDRGLAAVERGLDEQRSLLQRCIEAANSPKSPPKMKKPTFAAARAALQSALRAAGWQLSPPYNPQGKPYKVPYATSPDGVVRLWFKTEAVYAAVNTSDIGQAHSACSDMRELDPYEFAANIHEDVVRWHMRMRERGL